MDMSVATETDSDSATPPPGTTGSAVGRLVVVSNRVGSNKSVQTGGLATALQGALEKHGGLWFGWSGQVIADEAEPSMQVRSGHVGYATMDLRNSEYQGFYCSFANRVLWPLFHYRPDLIDFNRDSYEAYLAVNQRFAEQLCRLVGPDDVIWIHDYHLIPLAGYLRRAGLHNRIGFFLHTPLAPPELLSIIPSHDTLFGALQHCNLIGVQQYSDLRALQEYFRRELGARLGPDNTLHMPGGGHFQADVFAISIDPAAIADQAQAAVRRSGLRRLSESLQGRAMIIGVDRLDYSKGLPVRFDAFGRLLEHYPALRRRVTLLQIAPPTRGEVPEYQNLRLELEQIAGHVNGLYAEPDWIPIRYLNRSFSQRLLTGFYRLARAALVTPLRDGMNLVAKEYVAAQDPSDPGVLILSRFAGAAAQLDDALLVNPFDTDAVTDAIVQALEMRLEERQERWQQMMKKLEQNDIHGWTDHFIARLTCRTTNDNNALKS